MPSLTTIHRSIMIYVGLFIIMVGLFGSILQVITLTSVPYYRKTPSTFYFLIAAIHECGQFIATTGPLVVGACLDIDMSRLSAAWCKLRFFFTSSLSAIPLTCACLATIDQFLITCQQIRLRRWSTIKNAHRVSLVFVIVWWIHGTLWLVYQDMSPVEGVCFYRSRAFYFYAVFFFSITLGGAHVAIMVVFGILTYRNIRKTTFLMRLRVDRQITITVFMQVMLVLIGLLPYDLFNVYIIITKDYEKDSNQIAIEALIFGITSLFATLAFGVSSTRKVSLIDYHLL